MKNEDSEGDKTMDPRNIYLSEEAPTFENLASGLYYRLQKLRQENNGQERLGTSIAIGRETSTGNSIP